MKNYPKIFMMYSRDRLQSFINQSLTENKDKLSVIHLNFLIFQEFYKKIRSFNDIKIVLFYISFYNINTKFLGSCINGGLRA